MKLSFIMVAVLAFTASCVQRPHIPPPLPPVDLNSEPSLIETQGTGAVGVISRSYWAQSNPRGNINPMTRIHRLTIHHDALFSNITEWGPIVQRLRAVQRAHFQRNWADIGYHFIIDRHGRIWEGRLLRFQGAHASNHNEGNIGIMLLGNFDEQHPSQAQKDSLKRLVDHLRQEHKIVANHIYTHGELSNTRCPGKHLQDYVNVLRR